MEAKPRIALVSSEYPPNICGGLGVHVHQMTRTLRNQVRFDLFVPQYDAYLPDPGIHLHEIPALRAAGELEFWVRFCHQAVLSCQQSAQVDLIHCHDWMTALAGIRLRQLLKVPLVFNVHLPEHIGSRRDLENLGLVAADLVIVNSQEVRNELLARDLPIRQIEVVPNGVDSSVFCPGKDWPNDGGYVLFVGRLVAQKGLDLLLRAFSAVLQRCPESRLVIAGEGDLELFLKRLVRYLGFPDRVTFVAWQTGPALVSLFQRAQAVVMPSYYEPFGIVALEAMACGRPVIASRVGGLSEIIREGIEGHLVPVGDHLQLARRLCGLLLDGEQRERMGRLARTRALEFDWRSAASRTLDLYDATRGIPVLDDSCRCLKKIGQDLFSRSSDGLTRLGLELLGLT